MDNKEITDEDFAVALVELYLEGEIEFSEDGAAVLLTAKGIGHLKEQEAN